MAHYIKPKKRAARLAGRIKDFEATRAKMAHEPNKPGSLRH